MAESPNNENTMASNEKGGNLLRLHFACEARLPIGSTLRVTSAVCMTPGVPQTGPSSAGAAASLSEGYYTSNMGQDEINNTLQGYGNIYSETVEMATTPEEYPIWRTKDPVIVVVNGSDQQVLQHYYRYVVITPGVEEEEEKIRKKGKLNKNYSDITEGAMDTSDHTNNISIVSHVSSNAIDVSQVIMWEDPYKDEFSLDNEKEVTDVTRASYASLPSIKMVRQIKNLANLPFRTKMIPLQSNTTETQNPDEDMEELDEEKKETRYTDDGIRIDVWENQRDEAFQTYTAREVARNKAKFQTVKSETLFTSSHGSSGMEASELSTATKERIFLVCFHLPVILKKDPIHHTWSATWNESLLAKSPNSILEKTHELHFVGHVTLSPANGIESERDQILIREALAPMGCTPLFLESELMEAHYLGMCKQVLWPAFHNIDLLDLSTSGWGQREHLAPTTNFKTTQNPDSSSFPKYATNVRSTIESGWDQSILDKWWEAYMLVNQFFADKLAELLQPGDTTWVHDYHLALLPNMLDAKEQKRFGRRTSKMVFFLHIPFPTSQIFRELECGEAILQGMLHADIIGFHAFDHARHFLNAAKRILGLRYESLVGGLIGVQYRGKNVLVTMSNVSIEPDVVDKAMTLPSVVEGTLALQSRHKDRILITGVDIAQRLSGITFKLLAFERLLTDYPVWKDKAVMVQRCLIPGSRRADEANTIREVRFLIRRIQEKFGRHVMDYQEVKGSSLPIEQRLALWGAADCLMISPVREGLNMIPMEYVYARKAPLAAGVTIASEFSAVCSILNGALRVNPFDIQLTAANIDKALSMDVKEKESRHTRDIEFVSNFPKEKWTRNVLRDLGEVARQADDDDEEKKNDSDEIDSLSTSAFLARAHEATFTHLNNEEVTNAYNASSRRVIFLDFNGTIVIKEPPGKYLKREILGTSGLKPPTSVITALTELTADPQNIVYVVSGDSHENVENAIGHVPGLGLAASNGALFSPPMKTGEITRSWQTFDLGVDWDAVKRVSLPVLSKYTARTNGSFVKLTHSSIGWSYYSCDPEWGSLQASHLVLELEAELQAFDVRFVTLKGIVEIVPRRLNKGLIVKKVLSEARQGGLDFILCMGDDISDEKMFTSVFSYISEMKKENIGTSTSWPNVQTLPDIFRQSQEMNVDQMNSDEDEGKSLYSYTVTVGRKPSHASQYVDDARDVAKLIVTLTGRKFNERSLSFDEMNEKSGSDFFA